MPDGRSLLKFRRAWVPRTWAGVRWSRRAIIVIRFRRLLRG